MCVREIASEMYIVYNNVYSLRMGTMMYVEMATCKAMLVYIHSINIYEYSSLVTSYVTSFVCLFVC